MRRALRQLAIALGLALAAFTAALWWWATTRDLPEESILDEKQ